MCTTELPAITFSVAFVSNLHGKNSYTTRSTQNELTSLSSPSADISFRTSRTSRATHETPGCLFAALSFTLSAALCDTPSRLNNVLSDRTGFCDLVSEGRKDSDVDGGVPETSKRQSHNGMRSYHRRSSNQTSLDDRLERLLVGSSSRDARRLAIN